MGDGFRSRVIVSALLVATLGTSACDSDGDESNQVNMTISIQGNGTGRIEARSPFVDFDCRVEDGEISGTCEDVFIDTDGAGVVRILSIPNPNTDFTWGSPCQGETLLCEIEFDTETQSQIDVGALFEAKTKTVVMDPPSAFITQGGEEGSITIVARAVDENGGVVPNVSFLWEVDRPDVVSMAPVSLESVKITPLSTGQAIVSATVQGVVGRTGIDVTLSN